MKFKVFTFTESEPIEIESEFAQSDIEYVYFGNSVEGSDKIDVVAIFSRADFRYFLVDND